MIQFENIRKDFRIKNSIVTALQDVSLEIVRGDIFGVIGYSGAGKSTLLRMVNALETPTGGKVVVNGKDLANLHAHELSKVKKRIGMIFQHFNLLESKTIFYNVAIPLVLNKTSKRAIRERVMELLDYVGLADKADSYPSQLSGGQKQRVGIARALVTNPEILLCDEATSALDPKTTLSILRLLKQINRELNITIMMVTHEMNAIREICNKVAVMENGKVVESGNVPDVFGSPKSSAAREFVGTVIHDEIPAGILEELKRDKRKPRIYKMKIFGKQVTDSFLFELAREFDLEASMVFANVTELQGTSLSIMIIAFWGEEMELDRLYNRLTGSSISVEEVIL
ncbi:methionine ABC transporter ATP-binding protein [Bhargavaea cecembensis]|uniref:methionine ABC transporter ATP-binding protein n=1 Tax=Bhargavaea cecembensis TaxID=394098 RepID=UPI00058E10D9|nr:ATP-binding cassette domain-containing protein [Bhargavaea cecembensis]